MGENGAGKSTLIKFIAGVVQPDAGEMRLDGQPVRFVSPSAATAQGVVRMFQELSLIPDLSVADDNRVAAPEGADRPQGADAASRRAAGQGALRGH
ncbi:MAG: ATP-binding cassette domain-containing protein [Tabrizicola sp.]